MFVLNENVEFDRLGDESVLHLPSGASLALNETGTLVAQGIADGLPIHAIAQSLSERYGLDFEAASSDSMRFLRQLQECGAVLEDGSSRWTRSMSTGMRLG